MQKKIFKNHKIQEIVEYLDTLNLPNIFEQELNSNIKKDLKAHVKLTINENIIVYIFEFCPKTQLMYCYISEEKTERRDLLYTNINKYDLNSTLKNMLIECEKCNLILDDIVKKHLISKKGA